jgi:hypothetical protein
MEHEHQHCIDGGWVDPLQPIAIDVIDPSTEAAFSLIQAGIDEGAEFVTGGRGRPEHFNCGWFVRPTVFARVRTDMTIAREEIFGPVLAILPYRYEAEAIATRPMASPPTSGPAIRTAPIGWPGNSGPATST